MDIPDLVIAALVAGVVSYLVSVLNRSTALDVRDKQTDADRALLSRKVDADLELALRRVDADVSATMSERAWADYEMRRDVYLRLSSHISCLFENGDPAERPGFHQLARNVRLIGSDEVVRALNSLTQGIKANEPNLDHKYSSLFNAMRRDIRRIHSLPPEGTDLGEEAFPIEG